MKTPYLILLSFFVFFSCSINNDLKTASAAEEKLSMDNLSSLNKILSDLNSQERCIGQGNEKGWEFTFSRRFTCEFPDIPALIKCNNDILSTEGFDDYEIYSKQDELTGNWVITIVGNGRKLERIFLEERI